MSVQNEFSCVGLDTKARLMFYLHSETMAMRNVSNDTATDVNYSTYHSLISSALATNGAPVSA